MSGILQESWLGKVAVGWDSFGKLYAFEECYCYEMKLWCKERNTWVCIFVISLG